MRTVRYYEGGYIEHHPGHNMAEIFDIEAGTYIALDEHGQTVISRTLTADEIAYHTPPIMPTTPDQAIRKALETLPDPATPGDIAAAILEALGGS